MSNKSIVSEYAFGNIGTFREVPIDALTNPDHPLTPLQIHQWATIEAGLSHGFKTGSVPPSSRFADGVRYISEVMNDLDRTFLYDYNDLNTDYLKEGGFRDIFRQRIEDPGMLHNAVYFEVGKDPTSVSFLWHTWRGDIAKSMDFLHDFGWDLHGRCQKVAESSTWHHVNMIEGMAISERETVSDYVSRVKKLTASLKRLPRITCFGGGNLPERHYGLPEAEITVFDNGKCPPLEQLFLDATTRSHVRYIVDDLMTAIKYPELFDTQDIISMLGVAPCLGEFGTVQAIIFGEELLHDKGIFVFNLLVMNESLRRLLWTQLGDQSSDKMIFTSTGEAMTVGMNIVNIANESLEKKHVIFASEPPRVTKIGAWGATSVRFYLKKHKL